MILVVDALGLAGRHAVRLLRSKGEDVRALTDVGASIGGDAAPTHVSVRPLAAGDARHVRDTLDGADTMIFNPSAMREPEKLLSIAQARGIERVVLLSSMAIDDSSIDHQPSATAARLLALEEYLRSSHMEWIILRTAPLMGTALYRWAPQARQSSQLLTLQSDPVSGPVDELDVAHVATRLVTSDAHVGATYELSGPALLSESSQVRSIATASRRTLTPVPTGRAQLLLALRDQLLPTHGPDWGSSVADELADTDAFPQRLTPAVRRLTGRPARTFQAWAQRHTAAFLTPHMAQMRH
jgi:uncharacterized protein YbjT (DUF2867 family)